MTYSTLKKIEAVCAVLALIGFIIALGVAGASDYADEIGQYYPLANITKGCVAAGLLMTPSLIVSYVKERWVFEDDCEE